MDKKDDNRKALFSRGLRAVLLGAGFLCTGLGVIGIFLPLLPTVPFLLLATACFARSSERFHTWLIDHPRFGQTIKAYLHGRGIPRRSKIAAISTLWLTLTPASLFLIPVPWVRLLLFAVGAGVTLYLLRLPTLDPGRTATDG